MTLYCDLVAEQPLPTIDCRGIEELTVKEMKLLYPAATDQVWYSLPDETLLIHAADESAFGQLHILSGRIHQLIWPIITRSLMSTALKGIGTRRL